MIIRIEVGQQINYVYAYGIINIDLTLSIQLIHY